MLQLQRASAGSGKTFTLAKKFIWYYITISTEGSKPRLRTHAELEDSLKHILAVTFTNKAANEMQQRIVDKLFALGWPEMTEDSYGRPDYQEEFMAELGVSVERLAEVCRMALVTLFHVYSDFNVSTIDSFFQGVLRTFAYETGINDAYHVEIDSDYLSRTAINAMLEEMDTKGTDEDTHFWVSVLMNRHSSSGWNIFQRRDVAGGSTPYSALVQAVKRLENEDYKKIRSGMERFLHSHRDFPQTYRRMTEWYDTTCRQAYAPLAEAAGELLKSLDAEMMEAGSRKDIGKFRGAAERVLAYKPDIPPDADKRLLSLAALLDKKSVAAYLEKNPDIREPVTKASLALEEAYGEWLATVESVELTTWRLYEENFPFLGLFSNVVRKRAEYLDENNALELGETSVILREMINEDDAPFIYERLGTYLNHFLIDEFQDTSRLQWDNLRPLLAESLSRENDNLIIGDAKQSIYRFRNADPNLITHKVGEDFPERVIFRGEDAADNTNWRSRLQVVRFNNTLFRFLTRRFDDIFLRGDKCVDNGEGPRRLSFADLYSNVVQYPHHKERDGYVEVQLYSWGDKKETLTREKIAGKVPGIIADMLARGYRSRDIAVLVRSSAQAALVIDAILAYNRDTAPDTPIRFISEQSLKIAESSAVRIVAGCLESIARGADPEAGRDGEIVAHRRPRWREIESNYRYYRMTHPDLATDALITGFLADGADFNPMREMLQEMQSVALPALVEAIIEKFVPEALRRRDAIYLAAFQDLVLEYCEMSPTDVASFLNWWDRKKESAAISSPEGTDAVEILTIHKSKGLEYAGVIVPFADWDFSDTVSRPGSEWRWVTPRLDVEDVEFPPYLPVAVSEKMCGTPHYDRLTEYYDLVKLDNINLAYVAFTRAVDELYIFSGMKQPPKSDRNSDAPGRPWRHHISGFIEEMMTESLFAGNPGDEPEALLDASDVSLEEVHEDGEETPVRMIVRIGEKFSHARKGNRQPGAIILEDYPSVKTPSYLRYREEELPGYIDLGVEGEEDPDISDREMDPRSDGNIMHAVLADVVSPEDVVRSARRLRIAGLLGASREHTVVEELQGYLSDSRVSRWFDGSGEVITERSILHGDDALRRPDRVVIYPDGHAEVIDYKFGEVRTDLRYARQVRRYVEALKSTGEFRSVSGYLWYVRAGHIEMVSD